MYHRVDELPYDPWELAVSPSNFEEQLQVLQRHWNPISLDELGQYMAAGSIPDRSVVLTFDDGYIDNFIQAKPLLEKYKIPATFFIATRNCEEQNFFWWDELQQIILDAEVLPRELNLAIGGEQFYHDLADDAMLTPERRDQQRTWVAFSDEPTQRCTLYLELWNRIRPLPDAEQQEVLAELRVWANGVANQHGELVCMTPEQIIQLNNDPLFSVGAHTVTHPALSEHTAAKQQQEIVDSRNYLVEKIGQPISLFAYPFGKFSDTTVQILNDQHFSAAVTTHEGPITRFSHPLRLSRYQAYNWDGDEFQKQLTHWSRN